MSTLNETVGPVSFKISLLSERIVSPPWRRRLFGGGVLDSLPSVRHTNVVSRSLSDFLQFGRYYCSVQVSPSSGVGTMSFLYKVNFGRMSRPSGDNTELFTGVSDPHRFSPVFEETLKVVKILNMETENYRPQV